MIYQNIVLQEVNFLDQQLCSRQMLLSYSEQEQLRPTVTGVQSTRDTHGRSEDHVSRMLNINRTLTNRLQLFHIEWRHPPSLRWPQDGFSMKKEDQQHIYVR